MEVWSPSEPPLNLPRSSAKVVFFPHGAAVMPRSTALAPRSAPSRFKEDGGQTRSQILLGQGDDMDQRMKQIVKLVGG